MFSYDSCERDHVESVSEAPCERERAQTDIQSQREREIDRDLDRVGNGCFNQISIGLKLFGFCFCLLNKTTCLSLPCDLHITRGSIHVIEAYVILVFWGGLAHTREAPYREYCVPESHA